MELKMNVNNNSPIRVISYPILIPNGLVQGTKGMNFLIMIRNVAKTIFAKLSDFFSKTRPISLKESNNSKIQPPQSNQIAQKPDTISIDGPTTDEIEVDGEKFNLSVMPPADETNRQVDLSTEAFVNATQNKRGEFMRPSYVDKFIEFVMEKKPGEIDNGGVLLKKSPSEMSLKKSPSEMSLNETPPKTGITLYPYVFKGSRFRVDHIVLVAIDHGKKEIMYYDPQGLTHDDPTRKTKEIDMKEDLEKLGKKCFPDKNFTIQESKSAHQTDSHSCGVYVLTAMKKLAEGESFQDTMNHCKETPVTHLRRGLTDSLIQNIVTK